MFLFAFRNRRDTRIPFVLRSSLLWSGLRRSLVREGETYGIIAHVFGPVCDQLRELSPVICEERSCRFFESGEIPGRRGQEPICCFLRGAYTVAISAGSPRFIHQLSECDGS